jgi:3D (Asp-Asp-Asp) domain-containing protein
LPPGTPADSALAPVFAAPETLEVVSETTCPEGWDDLGDFRLTAYVLAQEAEFGESAPVDDVCGLEGTWPHAFLFDQGVRLQGSGRARDGRIVHYRGGGCFEVLDCPLTASGRCARSDRTVAVDPRVIPMGSELLIEGLGRRRAEDVGGGIRGNHIDVYYGDDVTYVQARSLSRSGRVCVRREAGQRLESSAGGRP